MESLSFARLDVGSVNVPYLLARYLRRFVAGRKSEAQISGGQFVAQLAKLFGLLTAEPWDLRGSLMLRMVPLRTIPQLLGRLEEEVQGFYRDVRSLRGLVERSMTDQGRFSTWMISCMAQLMDASGLTYQAFLRELTCGIPETHEDW
nr:hypothetical protein [Tanacetum cinerariifolium]